MPKRKLGINVFDAAQQRIAQIFDDFPRIYVSFSGGKDSGVLLHLVAEEAAKRKRQIGILFVDLEGQYKVTIDYIQDCFDLYSQHEKFWCALPLSLRNAVSMIQPRWQCWDPSQREKWIRQPPSDSITDIDHFPFFYPGMEFEEFVPGFGEWYSHGKATMCLVGIRAQESLNRFRTLIANKSRHRDLCWTTYKGGTVYNGYPIYDWATEDIWRYFGKSGKPWNKLYDLMHRSGVSIHQARICQPYGDDQRRGLWLYHIIEPESWSRVVARVSGANSGALYCRETGNMQGYLRVTKPGHCTWKQYAQLVMDSMPPKSQEHYRAKISVFIKWWADRDYPTIPDEADEEAERAKTAPSWRRIAKVLLKNDWWCKGLSFTITKAKSYDKYLRVQRARQNRWNIRI